MMIGERLTPAYPPIIERRPNPHGPGIIVRRTVDIQRITDEMAVPTAVISEQAKNGSLPIDPKNDTRQGYL